MKFACETLFDITPTGVTGHFKSSRVPFNDQLGQAVEDELSWNRARNQQRNWETITQLIGLRAQISELKTPIKRNNVWYFEFAVETPDAYGDSSDPTQILRLDANGVPMLIELDNRKDLEPVLVPDQNIWFSALP